MLLYESSAKVWKNRERKRKMDSYLILVLKSIANPMHSSNADLKHCHDVHWSGIKTGSIECILIYD